MSDCIDATMQSVEATGSSAVSHPVLVESQASQLANRYDAVLLRRELCEEGIGIGVPVAHIATKPPERQTRPFGRD